MIDFDSYEKNPKHLKHEAWMLMWQNCYNFLTEYLLLQVFQADNFETKRDYKFNCIYS